MAKGDSTDLMMKFVLRGRPIAGESTTELISAEGKTNPLLKGFDPGCYIEIDRFTFKAGIRDNEDTSTTPTTKPSNARDPKVKPARTLAATATRGSYQSWRSGKAHNYPAELQPISFSRQIDKTSSVLIQNCIDCVSYDSATLIKRKASGVLGSDGQVAAGEVFLRLDFIGVLVIKVDWDNDDKVNESCDFICRSVTISYRPQLPDGSLGRIVPGFWSMVPGERQLALA